MNMDNDKLYNSKIIEIYVRYILKHYPEIDIRELLNGTKIKAYEIDDSGHWFTQEQVDLFYHKAVLMTKNKNLAREAGRFAASADALGLIKYWTLSLLSPASVFSVINKASSLLTRSAEYKSVKICKNKYEVIVTPRANTHEKHFQCENRLGFFESIVCLFGYNKPKIEHKECMFHGYESCKYIISWRTPIKSIISKIINILAVLSIFVIILAYIYIPSMTIWNILGLFSFILFAKLACIINDNLQLKSYIETLKYTSNKLIEQVNVNYSNSILTYEVGAAITKQVKTQDIVSNVVALLKDRLDYDRGLIMLANEHNSILKFQAGYGYTAYEFNLLKKSNFNLKNRESRGAFVLAFHNQEPILVNDIDEIENDLSPRSLDIAKRLGTHSFICCPIIYENDSLGVLAVDNKVSKRPLVERDLSFLMGIAHFIGVSLHNTSLLETKELQFKSLIKTLAASIDARDPCTAGHSERVSLYAIEICRKLGISEKTQEMIHVAALLHDYGKLAVPDAILNKPGPLSKDEHKKVQLHTDKTREILKQIHFEGEFSKVPDIAAAHHERLDGTGYPRGLKGAEIPLESQIIAVADFFEAITAKRPYRDPIPMQQALDMLEQGKGTQFQPEIVDALKNYIKQSNGALISLV